MEEHIGNITTEVKENYKSIFTRCSGRPRHSFTFLNAMMGNFSRYAAIHPRIKGVIAKRISRRSTGFVAKAPGITIPQALLAAADAIID